MAQQKSQMVEETGKFRRRIVVNVSGMDTVFNVKCSVNYEKATYKVQPILNMQHGWDEEIQDALAEVTAQCVADCQEKLHAYNVAIGRGSAAEFDFSGGVAAASN